MTLKYALAAALTVGLAASGITTMVDQGSTIACGGEDKKSSQPAPKPQPKPPSLACGGEEKKTSNPKPQPKPPSVWAIG